MAVAAVSPRLAAHRSVMRDRIVRLCVLLQALRASRRGLTVAMLVAETGSCRATVYRDLRVLRDAGVWIERELVNGQARHRRLIVLPSAPMPSGR